MFPSEDCMLSTTVPESVGVAHVLSPLKNVVASAVPVAERSAVTLTAPVVATSGVKSIYVPSVVTKEVTPSLVIVTLPVPEFKLIPVPANARVTPVFSKVNS